MAWGNIVDTFLNVGVFAFIAFLVWVYLKKEPTTGEESQITEGEREI
jgi:hypothetical protein